MNFVADYKSDDDRAMDADEDIVVRDVDDDSSAGDDDYDEVGSSDEVEGTLPAIHFASDLEYIARQVCLADGPHEVPPHLRDDDDRPTIADDDSDGEAMGGSSASSEDSDDDDVLKQEALVADSDDDDSGDDLALGPRDADADALTEEEAQLGASTAPPKTQHELDEDAALLPLPAAPDVLQVQLGARRDQLRLAGEVLYRIDHEQTVVIQGVVADGGYALNEGTVLCTTAGVVVGVVHEVFGPVAAPFYIVRYRSYRPTASAKASSIADATKSKRNAATRKNKPRDTMEGDADEPLAAEAAAGAEEVETPLTAPQLVDAHLPHESATQERTLREIPAAIQPGIAVFTVPDHATFLTPQLLRSLRTLKGSDASNAYDEEVGEDEVDYSDDEAEQRAKKATRDRRRGAAREPPSAAAAAAADDFSCIPPGRRRVALPPQRRAAPTAAGHTALVTAPLPSPPPSSSSFARGQPIHVPVEHFLRQPPPQMYGAQPPPPQSMYPFALPGVVYPPVAAAYPPFAGHAPGSYQYAPLALPQQQQQPPPPPYCPPR